MRKIAASVSLLLLVACASNSERDAEASAAVAAKCDSLLGDGWSRVESPANAKDLLSIAHFHVRPAGFVWYTSNLQSFSACAFTHDPDGCGYGAHEFVKIGKRWFYAPGNYLERICVAG